MKKNLISVLILALVIVNIVLTSILLFSLASPIKKTSNMVTNISSILSLELEGPEKEDTSKVSIDNLVPHDIDEEFTIPLKHSSHTDEYGNIITDSKDHYCIVEVSLMLNSANEDYAKYSETISSHDSMFKGIIVDVIGSHTLEEIRDDTESVRNEILDSIREMYDGSEFVYKVNFTNVMYQ
ncbi:MAG: flagellar basal body-associated FliL family protein [Lachnospiraceae bacterium]|nr:flagellar basal body-associated FliL family protein [Lachnospiraceae bacterium]